jgi:hypothetical protein
MRRALLFCLCWAALADEPWKLYGEKNGVRVERRKVEGSSFFQQRATVDASQPPEVVVQAIWSGVIDPPKTVKKRTVLEHDDNRYLVYDQIHTPVVSDRDATILIWREGLQIRFEAVNDRGPALDPHYIRLTVIRGSWNIRPMGSGSRIVYECYNEPAGSIPAWMVRGAQADQMFLDVQRILDRLK